MTSSRDKLLLQLSDGQWHPGPELGPSPFDHGIEAWVRLLRLSGYEIEERLGAGVTEYRLVVEQAQDG